MINTKDPLVSVIVTTYNRKQLLKETIDSILNQSFKDFELIVVDNYSNYYFIAFMKSFNDDRIRAFQNQNNGIIAINRNFGIKKAKGKYIAFCDDDDLWDKHKLQKQIKAFQNNIQFGVVAVGTEVKLTSYRFKVKRKQQKNSILLFKDLFYSHSATLSSLIIENKNIQLFLTKQEFIAVEDFEYQVRLLQRTKGKLLILKEPLVTYRVVNSSMSSEIIRYSNIINVIEFYRKDLTKKIYEDALYLAYLKIGLKCLKKGIPAKNYFLKSVNHNQSVKKQIISLSLTWFSLLPSKVILKLLDFVYRSAFITNIVYGRLTKGGCFPIKREIQ